MCELRWKIPHAVNLKLNVCSILCILISSANIYFLNMSQKFGLVTKHCNPSSSYNKLVSNAWIYKLRKKYIILIKIQLIAVVASWRCIFGFLLFLNRTPKHPLSMMLWLCTLTLFQLLQKILHGQFLFRYSQSFTSILLQWYKTCSV